MSLPFVAKIPALPDWHALVVLGGLEAEPVIGPNGKVQSIEIQIVWVSIMFWGIRLPSNLASPMFPNDTFAGMFDLFIRSSREPLLVPLDGAGSPLEGERLLLICAPGETFPQAMERWNKARDEREARARR